MQKLQLILALLIITPLVLAASTPDTPLSSTSLGIPQLPEEETYTFNLHVIANQGNVSNNAIAFITLQRQTEKITTQITNSKITTNLLTGSDYIEIAIDEFDTPGFDYYAYIPLTNKKEINVELIPVGSLKIQIENATSKTAITISSLSSYYIPGLDSLETDQTGNLYAKTIPVQTAFITAESNDLLGSSEANVQKGQIAEVKIKLNKTKNSIPYALAGGVILIILILGILAYQFTKQNKTKTVNENKTKQTKPTKQPTSEKPLVARRATGKLKTIMYTLVDREREIVELIVKNGGSMQQAKLNRELLIPKASLSRTIDSLERRGVLNVRQNGKINELELHEDYKS